MKINIKHQSRQTCLEIDPQATVLDLRERIHELTSVPIANQKLLPKPAKGVTLSTYKTGSVAGDAAHPSQSPRLDEVGVVEGHTILVLGATQSEVDRVHQEEEQASKWKQPRNYHPSLLRGTKPRSTGRADISATAQPFLAIKPHHGLRPDDPLYPRVMAYLERLANDAGVLHVCRLHGYVVGQLTELLPWENPELLGLNENRGQVISLQIRADNAGGFRHYKTTRQVLLHELAHNDIGGHPVEFRELNSKLNAELAAYERSVQEGTHVLHEGDMYVPPDPMEAEAGSQSYVLGGSRDAPEAGLSADASSSESRRQVVLQATMRRLEKAEATIEAGCGSSTQTQEEHK